MVYGDFMKNIHNSRRKLKPWTAFYGTKKIDYYGSDSFGVMTLTQYSQLYRSFSIGFFSFHYICAVREGDTELRKDSLQILSKLVTASHLDKDLIKGLDTSREMEYTDFFEQVYQNTLAVLRKTQGPKIQQGAELGFGLAAVYAGLVETMKMPAEGRAQYLTILEKWLSGLSESSKKMKIPDILLQPVLEGATLLRRSANPPEVHKCMQILKLVIKHGLSTGVVSE
jgi:hypothetical protein